MPTNDDFQGVSNCYVFKSRLQEYAQKVGLSTPVYETIKEGPSHEPCFRSTVIVNEVRYDSLPGFFNRKAAEQSAAEVALVELARSNEVNQSITQPVHETGLCKNLLQEYAQKMNYAMPLYQCKKDEAPSRAAIFTCTVEIGGILYIGGAAKTKKEAEIKAARTALLAIQSSASHSSQNQLGHAQLTVLPCRKRAAEPANVAVEASNAPKPKKARFKKKNSKRKPRKDKMSRVDAKNVAIGANINPEVEESHANVNDESGSQEMKSEPFISEAVKNHVNGISVNLCEKETLAGKGSMVLNDHISFEDGESIDLIGLNVNPEVESHANVNDESGFLEMKSGPFASEAMKNSRNGISVNLYEKETLAGEGSMVLNGNVSFEDGKSTELFGSNIYPGVESHANVNDESGSQEMKSGPCVSEAMKNSENGISVNLCEKETLAGGCSPVLNGDVSFENVKSTELIGSNINPEVESRANVNDESSPRETKSRPFASEAVQNPENGISVNSCAKETLAVDGSPVLNGHVSSENVKSTELHFEENIAAEVSCVDTNGDKPEMSVEMNKQQQDNGDMNTEI